MLTRGHGEHGVLPKNTLCSPCLRARKTQRSVLSVNQHESTNGMVLAGSCRVGNRGGVDERLRPGGGHALAVGVGLSCSIADAGLDGNRPPVADSRPTGDAHRCAAGRYPAGFAHAKLPAGDFSAGRSPAAPGQPRHRAQLPFCREHERGAGNPSRSGVRESHRHARAGRRGGDGRLCGGGFRQRTGPLAEFLRAGGGHRASPRGLGAAPLHAVRPSLRCARGGGRDCPGRGGHRSGGDERLGGRAAPAF